LKHHIELPSAAARTTQAPRSARTSFAFRLSASLATALLILAATTSLLDLDITEAPAWGLALLSGAGLFFLSDLLLPVLVVAIPPGMFVLALVGLLRR
jgi:hypothetical protein